MEEQIQFINEQKILDYLQNDLKVPLVAVNNTHAIIKSPISQLNKLIDFVTPLHYYVSYVCQCIYINPR